MSIFIAMPTYKGSIETRTMSCMVSNILNLNARGLNYIFFAHEYPYISKNRNAIVSVFMKTNLEKLMFVDSDMIFPSDAIYRLTQNDKDIVSGIYLRRGKGHTAMVYDWDDAKNDFRDRDDIPFDEAFQCAGLGAGFMAIKRKVFEAFTPVTIRELGQPFSMKTWHGGAELGEDLAFCWRAKRLGFEIWGDPRVMLGHIGTETLIRKPPCLSGNLEK